MKRFKRWCAAVLAAALAFSLYLPAWGVTTSASCAILMDAGSGRVLYAQRIHEQRLIASITKLMTALVAVEQCEDVDAPITVLPEWTGIEGSSIYLQAGEEITLRALLYGLLLQSGNDAATAIACHVAGDEEGFAALMNRRAQQLGMENSSFANPSGLNQEGHYSTAYDMALLACACLENELVSQICATPSITVGKRTFVNHNKLLYRYEGCVGMKTGYTELAGRTLISAAERGGQTLVCVTLNDGNDWEDHETLLDYGFKTYPLTQLCADGERFGRIPVEGSLLPCVEAYAPEGICYPLAEGEQPLLQVELEERLTAPVVAGQPVGTARWILDGETVAHTVLVCAGAGQDVKEPLNFFQRWIARLKGSD